MCNSTFMESNILILFLTVLAKFGVQYVYKCFAR